MFKLKSLTFKYLNILTLNTFKNLVYNNIALENSKISVSKIHWSTFFLEEVGGGDERVKTPLTRARIRLSEMRIEEINSARIPWLWKILEGERPFLYHPLARGSANGPVVCQEWRINDYCPCSLSTTPTHLTLTRLL